MSRKKVLHLTVGLGLGGAEKLMAEMAARLDPSRYETQVLALKGEGPLGDSLRARGVKVSALGGRGPWDVRVLPRAARFLREVRCDIVHSHLLWANLLACLLKGRSKVVWHEHDMDDWMGRPQKTAERLLIGRADTVIAISRAVADCVARREPFVRDRIRILHNAIPLKEKPTSPQGKRSFRAALGFFGEEKVVGYVGRLDEPKKGLKVLLHAAAEIAAEDPSVRFVVVGDGNARAALEAEADRLGLSNSVRFWKARENVEEVYGALDVFVLPSLWEGFGISLLEAMDEGLPVAGSRVGGIPEVVVGGETGLLSPPGDVEALAVNLRKLLADPALRRRLGSAGRARVQAQFGISKMVEELEKIYDETEKTQ